MTVRVYKAIQDDGTALWPEERPIEWLLKKKSTYPRPIFEAQFQNDPTGLRGVRYDISWLKYYTRATLPSLSNMVGVQTGDPATSERETSNYFGHCTAGKDLSTVIIYILDFAFGHIPATKHEEFLRAQYHLWTGQGLQIQKVLLEEVGPQQATTQRLAAETRLHPRGPMPLEILNPKGSKEQRYDSILVYLGNGTILFPGRMTPDGTVELVESREMNEFKKEFSEFPKTGRDDILDALWMAVQSFVDVGMSAGITDSDEEFLAEISTQAEELAESRSDWTLDEWDKQTRQNKTEDEDTPIIELEDDPLSKLRNRLEQRRAHSEY